MTVPGSGESGTQEVGTQEMLELRRRVTELELENWRLKLPSSQECEQEFNCNIAHCSCCGCALDGRTLALDDKYIVIPPPPREYCQFLPAFKKMLINVGLSEVLNSVDPMNALFMWWSDGIPCMDSPRKQIYDAIIHECGLSCTQRSHTQRSVERQPDHALLRKRPRPTGSKSRAKLDDESTV